MATFVKEYPAFNPGTASPASHVLTDSFAQGNHLFLFNTTGSSNDLTGVTDSRGNTWTIDVKSVAGARRVAIAHAYLATGLQVGDTITITKTGSGAQNNVLMEFTDMAPTVTFDKGSVGTQTNGTSVATGSTGALTDQRELAFSWMALGASGGTNPAYSDGTYTPFATGVNSRGGGWKQVTNGAAQGGTWSWTNSVGAGALVATYTDPTGAINATAVAAQLQLSAQLAQAGPTADAAELALLAQLARTTLQSQPGQLIVDAGEPSVLLQARPASVQLNGQLPRVTVQAQPAQLALLAQRTSPTVRAIAAEVRLVAQLPDVQVGDLAHLIVRVGQRVDRWELEDRWPRWELRQAVLRWKAGARR